MRFITLTGGIWVAEPHLLIEFTRSSVLHSSGSDLDLCNGLSYVACAEFKACRVSTIGFNIMGLIKNDDSILPIDLKA